MQDGPYPEVPPDFGHWLAGFIDGEGHFAISANTSSGYRCMFIMNVRADERAILREIVAVTGLGWLRFHGPYQRQPKASPAADWRVTDKAGCLRLIELLDQYPLRAKKARDYAIWREAVLSWATTRRANAAIGGRDWSAIAACKAQLTEARRYHE